MTDRPIIFSGPMVRALLDGRKTQTRRLATSPLRRCEVGDRLYVRERCWIWGDWRKDGLNKLGRQRWRFVPHGSRLVTFDPTDPHIATKATPRESSAFWSRPSIHMPRSASRLTLIVEQVRVERLTVISGSDAIAEGVERLPEGGGWQDYSGRFGETLSARESYASLWDTLHTADGQRWEDSPEIVALTFRVERGNIDRIGA